MSMPFYVSPEQAMKDKADYARKNIARGRNTIVIQFADGILFVAPNPSRALHKISEIYDRIAFAAVGMYNEFENLRKAGVRYADFNGYLYDRNDVTALGLANAYAQTLGTIFTESNKPYEVEIVVAEVGDDPRARPDLPDHLRRLGGRRARLRGHGRPGGPGRRRAQGAVLRRADADRQRSASRWPRSPARRTARPRNITAAQLEVAVLNRAGEHRRFRRLTGPRLEALLAEATTSDDAAPADGDGDGSAADSGSPSAP